MNTLAKAHSDAAVIKEWFEKAVPQVPENRRRVLDALLALDTNTALRILCYHLAGEPMAQWTTVLDDADMDESHRLPTPGAPPR